MLGALLYFRVDCREELGNIGMVILKDSERSDLRICAQTKGSGSDGKERSR